MTLAAAMTTLLILLVPMQVAAKGQRESGAIQMLRPEVTHSLPGRLVVP
jgi:hypothetical protein